MFNCDNILYHDTLHHAFKAERYPKQTLGEQSRTRLQQDLNTNEITACLPHAGVQKLPHKVPLCILIRFFEIVSVYWPQGFFLSRW